MVIFIGWLTKLFFKRRADSNYLKSIDNITLGLGKAAYFALKWIGITQGHNWNLLGTSWGLWFLCEIFVFVLLPCILFLIGSRNKNVGLIRFISILTIIGVIINRLNVSLIAFNWNLPHRELLHWKELIVVISIFTFAILVYRWIVNRMPVLHEHSDYKQDI